VVILKQY